MLDKAVLAEETKAILAELKHIPASDHAANRDLYERLADLHPDDASYRKKWEHYTKTINQVQLAKQKKEAQHRARIKRAKARFGEPPQADWNGVPYGVERYLKQVANDPGSIDVVACTTLSIAKDGWKIGCDYRGRNGFGGLVLNSSWFTISHNRVIRMVDG